MSSQLPLLNAILNATATVLLIVGYVLIRRRHEQAHKRVMLTAFGVSIAFLISYLAYHVWPVGARNTPFRGEGLVRPLYFTILITHVTLAAAVPVLALVTIWHGYRDHRLRHMAWARWTLPIWLYVSITGVVIYVMLYHIYPVRPVAFILH